MSTELNSLLPTNVDIEITDIISADVELFPEEITVSENYSPKRLREFIAGRANARQLLKKYNVQNYPLLPNDDRAPIWPDGIIGSISHCKDLCGVIISKSRYYRSIGFDVENIREFSYAARKFICTQKEEQWLSTQTQLKKNLALLLLFSIKESLYKCIYQADKVKLSFTKIRAIPQFKNNDFSLSPLVNKYQKYKDIKTRFNITEQHIFTFTHYLHH